MKLNINIIIIILILLTIALFLSKTETFETIQPDIMYSLDDAELIKFIYMPGSQGQKGAVGNSGRNKTGTISSDIMIQKTLDEMFHYGVDAAPIAAAPIAAAPVAAAPVAAAPIAAAPVVAAPVVAAPVAAAPVAAAPVVTAPPIIPYNIIAYGDIVKFEHGKYNPGFKLRSEARLAYRKPSCAVATGYYEISHDRVNDNNDWWIMQGGPTGTIINSGDKINLAHKGTGRYLQLDANLLSPTTGQTFVGGIYKETPHAWELEGNSTLKLGEIIRLKYNTGGKTYRLHTHFPKHNCPRSSKKTEVTGYNATSNEGDLWKIVDKKQPIIIMIRPSNNSFVSRGQINSKLAILRSKNASISILHVDVLDVLTRTMNIGHCGYGWVSHNGSARHHNNEIIQNISGSYVSALPHNDSASLKACATEQNFGKGLVIWGWPGVRKNPANSSGIYITMSGNIDIILPMLRELGYNPIIISQ